MVSYLIIIEVPIIIWSLLIFFSSNFPIQDYCSESTTNSWICILKSNNDKINCNQLEMGRHFRKINVRLIIKELESNHNLPIFEEADQCNVIRLIIETGLIPSNTIIGNLKSLEVLIIQKIQSPQQEIFTPPMENLLFGLNQLQIVNIEGFTIKLWVKDIFKSCEMVKEINLKNLEIETIDIESFKNCKNLKKLTLKVNKIRKLMTFSFSGIMGLTELKLSSNNIQEIITNGNGWNDLENLNYLDLSNNQIEQLNARQFLGLNHLQDLILTKNALKSISKEAFQGLEVLKTLDLRNNPLLRWFDLSILSPFKQSLTTLSVDSNNIHCINDKRFLSAYHELVVKVLNSIPSCDHDGTQTSSYTTPSTEWKSTKKHIIPISMVKMILILIVTILVMVLIFVLIFFIIYYCTTKSKIKKYKETSLNNSCRYSRTDPGSPSTVEFGGTLGTNYQNSDGVYGIFGQNPTLRSDSRRSHSCIVIN